MSWRSGEIGMMMNYIAHELKTVYEPDSDMTRSGNLGKKQKDCILPIREADGVVIDVCDLKNARLQWRTQLHRQFVAAVNALGLDSGGGDGEGSEGGGGGGGGGGSGGGSEGMASDEFVNPVRRCDNRWGPCLL
ncbi:hypothetical protein B296_00051600 [Ensete ventricosum]|uniref:Uncharacterized protein n=1 Tax=Ensete ventricosum TaxID=4639 RepID=A0A426XZT7_ENSVE|nr:hypothetical protein B296_00051600 [Ensete ventricosum]